MAGYGGFGGNPYGGFGGNPYGGFAGGNPYGGFAGGNIQREFEQERIGFGPQGYVVLILSNESMFSLFIADMECMNRMCK
jgi:hypothetical protein